MLHAVLAPSSTTAQMRPLLILDSGSIYFTAIYQVLRDQGYPATCIIPNIDTVDTLINEVTAMAPGLILMGAWLDERIIHRLITGLGILCPIIIIAWDEYYTRIDAILAASEGAPTKPILYSAKDLDELLIQSLA